MDKNFIKLNRCLSDDVVWELPDAHRIVWITILLEANWMPDSTLFNGEPKDLEPGEMVTSYDHLSRRSNVSVQQTRSALDNLEQLGLITRDVTNDGQWLKVVNWAKYQNIPEKQQAGEQGDNKGETKGQQGSNKGVTTHKENKEVQESGKPSEESGDSSSGADALPGNLDELPRNLNQWQAKVNQTDNPQGLLGTMIRIQYPDNPDPDFARLGKLVKENDPALIAEVLWKNNENIDGNVLDYITKAMNKEDENDLTVPWNEGSDQSQDPEDYVDNL